MSYEEFCLVLNDYLKTPTGKSSTDLLKDFIEGIGSTKGFTEIQLEEAFPKILRLDMSQKEIASLVLYMAPNEKVSSDTIDCVFGWAFIHFIKNKYAVVVKALFQWLIGVLLCKIIEKEAIKHCYYMLLTMLRNEKLIDEVCHLLYLITDHSCVTPYTTSLIQKYRKEYNNNYCVGALLSLQKRLKPHLLPKSMAVLQDEMKPFPILPKKLIHHFTTVNKSAQNALSLKRERYSNWKPHIIAFKRKKLDNIRYVAEMSTLEAIKEAKQSEVYFPGSMFEAFMENQFGFALLAVTNQEFQKLMEEYIRRFLIQYETQINNPEDEDFKKFLMDLCRIQDMYGQSIGSTDNFLIKILKNWTGKSYRQEILSLLKSFVVVKYKELFKNILSPLYNLNLDNDMNLACLTIKTLSGMLYNNHKNISSDYPPTFVQSTNRKPDQKSILKLQQAFHHICILFTNIFYNNMEILHEILDSHILLLNLQTSQILLPNGIVHKILINSDMAMINKLLRIIMTNIKRIPEKHKVPKQLAIQKSDIIEILFNSLFHSSIFKSPFDKLPLNKKIMDNKSNKSIFRARNNFIFMSLVRLNEKQKYRNSVKKDEFQSSLRQHCTYLYEFIEYLKD